MECYSFKGLNWLFKHETEINDTYSIVMINYLLHVLDHPKKESFFNRMEERALTDSKDGFKYWQMTPKHKDDRHRNYWDHDRVKK